MTQDIRTTNERLLRSGYEAFGAGDLAKVETLFHSDATWHAGRLGQLGGDHRGWPAIAAFFGQTMQLTNGSFTVTLEDTLTNDTHVAAVVRSRGEREGKRLEELQVHLFRFDGQQVAEIWQFAGAGADEFWS